MNMNDWTDPSVAKTIRTIVLVVGAIILMMVGSCANCVHQTAQNCETCIEMQDNPEAQCDKACTM